MKTYRSLVLGAVVCLSLSACQTTNGKMTDAPMLSASVDSATARAANAAGDIPAKPLPVAEKLYNKNPSDPLAAMEYARALREAKFTEKALEVLKPFAKSTSAVPPVLLEYSSVLLARGDYAGAETAARKVVALDAGNYKAYHNLGLALETQGKHPEAEQAFRKGLDLWQGNPTTVMNNLALNLASQGYLDESVDLLRKAQTLSPHRTEIERNIRIVTALQQAARGPAPKPVKKPAVGADG